MIMNIVFEGPANGPFYVFFINFILCCCFVKSIIQEEDVAWMKMELEIISISFLPCYFQIHIWR